MFKIASFFTGVGGIDIAFKNNNSEVVYMNEFDNNAIVTLKENFKSEIIDSRDLKFIDPKEIPKHDILIAGFPCQAFSIAGYRKGFEDSRGDLFFYLLRIIKKVKPRIVFLENVKNLLSHDNGKTFNIIYNSLVSNGYHVKYKIMNSKDYGNILQNRERIYIVAFKYKKDYKNFDFPEPIILKSKFSNYIYDFVDTKYYYNKVVFKNFDILEKNVTKKNTFYQWRRHYVRENKSGVCPTLTANMGTGGHNVPIIIDNIGIRKLTPRECFNLQGFPSNYSLPKIANCHLYKQSGNSVAIPVINRIAKNIYNVILKK